MIEESVFKEKSITSIVKKKYGIDVFDIKKMDRGSANIYVLNGNKYVLKEFQSKYTKQEINKEIKIINFLRKNGIPVPKYVQTLSKRYSFTYRGRVVIIEEYIDGYTMDSNSASKVQILESAQYLGKIVKCLNKSNIELPVSDIKSWYSKETLTESIEKHKKLLGMISSDKDKQIYNDLNNKIKMIEYVLDNVNFSDMDKVSIMKTHGDYSVLQFIYKNKKIESIIDFVSACQMPIIWEIIRSYSYIDPKAKDGIIDIDNFVLYVKEVSKYISLNEYDYKYMPYLYMVQLLTSTFGYKQYILDNSKKSLLDFALFRTRLCKYLFENKELISNALICEFK